MKQEKTLQFTVLVEIQPAHKTEFNNWYNDVHVPEVMASPGFLSNVRYEEVGAEGQYMAKYEISGEESLETPEFDKARGWKEMSSVVIRSGNALYRRIYTAQPGAGAREGGEPALLRFNRSDVGQGREEEYHRYYNQTLLPKLLECPGWLTASRYEAVRGTPQVPGHVLSNGGRGLPITTVFRGQGLERVGALRFRRDHHYVPAYLQVHIVKAGRSGCFYHRRTVIKYYGRAGIPVPARTPDSK